MNIENEMFVSMDVQQQRLRRRTPQSFFIDTSERMWDRFDGTV